MSIFSLSLLLASLDPVSASSRQRLASHFCSLSSACGGATGRLAVLAHRKMDSTVPRTSILHRPVVCLGLPLPRTQPRHTLPAQEPAEEIEQADSASLRTEADDI